MLKKLDNLKKQLEPIKEFQKSDKIQFLPLNPFRDDIIV